MYKSTIEIIYGQTKTQMEGEILRAIQNYGIAVDKEELIRALQYDRHQYEQGYADALIDNDLVKVVRCKDCWKSAEGLCSYRLKDFPGKDFCGDGERKVNDI